jgi:hypothetical protein
MHEPKQGYAGKRQHGHASDSLFPAKHLQLLGKFRLHGPGQIGDDSGAIASSAR